MSAAGGEEPSGDQFGRRAIEGSSTGVGVDGDRNRGVAEDDRLVELSASVSRSGTGAAYLRSRPVGAWFVVRDRDSAYPGPSTPYTR